MKTRPSLTLLLITATLTRLALAAPLPVREVTVFKDGHAFVVHEGKMPVSPAGEIVLDRLPTAVLGTFWAYAKDPQAKLISVTARQQRTTLRRTALTLRELLEANVGAEASITETNGLRYPASILGFPERSAEELAATSPPGTPEALPQKGNLVLLKTADGVKAVDVGHLQDVTFARPPGSQTATEEFRAALALKVQRRDPAAAKEFEVGLAYVQRGLRWIPSYRVDLDGQGRAQVRLVATLLNELIDLDDVTAQLVIGVPSFYFKDTLDPMALQESAAALSAYFQGSTGRGGRFGALASNFANSIMSQVATPAAYQAGRDTPSSGGDGPDLPEGTRNEDLFVFTVPHLTLKKGERMMLPLAEYAVTYEDVFTLDLPFAPPTELARSLNSEQQAEMARLLAGPKVMHQARLHNQSPYPFTTAPALVLREGRVIGQGLMTYAATGASTDLALTTAVDVQVKKSDRETKRSPNSIQVNGDSYMRVDLEGHLKLTNRRTQAVRIEIDRHVLGHVDTADHDGRITMSNVFESRDYLPAGDASAEGLWWNWFSWPWWWHHVNGIGRIEWTAELPAGESVEFSYGWHYFWR